MIFYWNISNSIKVKIFATKIENNVGIKEIWGTRESEMNEIKEIRVARNTWNCFLVSRNIQ